MQLTEILKDSNYKLTQFTSNQIERLEDSIFIKESRGKQNPYVKCLVRKKDIQLKPEEVVRQLYLMVLNDQYNYPFERMEIEYSVSFGREKNEQILSFLTKTTLVQFT